MNYLDTVYNEEKRPFTAYPQKLTRHIASTLKIERGASILDVGCGRGEFSQGFMSQGMQVYAVDREAPTEGYVGTESLSFADLETQPLPFDDNSFDYVFSKSVIEHFYYPEKLFSEIKRVLKPNGVVITMCPAWEFNYKTFYEDYTHRTPFMKSSLKDFLEINGFVDVTVDYFIQLPSTWFGIRRYFAKILVVLTRFLTPDSFKTFSKWVRFSKEVMLFSVGKKVK